MLDLQEPMVSENLLRGSVLLWVLEPDCLDSNPSPLVTSFITWARSSASVCLGFLVCEMVIIIVLIS